MNDERRISNRERVAKRRAALRAQGLRPKQIWVPDVRAAEYIAQARAEALSIAASEGNAEDIAFAEAVQFWPEAGNS